MNREVKKYMDAVTVSRKAKIDSLHTLITNAFPKAIVDMRYKMPTYHHGDGWVAISNQKNYVSLYTCGYHHIEKFKVKYPKVKTGKGCINFKDNDPMPLKDIKAVVMHAINHPKDTSS